MTDEIDRLKEDYRALEAEIATLRQERDQAMRSADAMTKAGRVAIDAINVLREAKEAAEAENARLREGAQKESVMDMDESDVGLVDALRALIASWRAEAERDDDPAARAAWNQCADELAELADLVR